LLYHDARRVKRHYDATDHGVYQLRRTPICDGCNKPGGKYRKELALTLCTFCAVVIGRLDGDLRK